MTLGSALSSIKQRFPGSGLRSHASSVITSSLSKHTHCISAIAEGKGTSRKSIGKVDSSGRESLHLGIGIVADLQAEALFTDLASGLAKLESDPTPAAW